MDAELKELEETTRGLQSDLERMIASEEQAKTRREHLDTQTNALRKELAAARSRLDRAEQIRNTCKRLTYLEDKLHPLAKAIKSGASIFVFSLLVELQADCSNFCDRKKLHEVTRVSHAPQSRLHAGRSA